jgi:hypothetical protein
MDAGANVLNFSNNFSRKFFNGSTFRHFHFRRITNLYTIDGNVRDAHASTSTSYDSRLENAELDENIQFMSERSIYPQRHRAKKNRLYPCWWTFTTGTKWWSA